MTQKERFARLAGFFAVGFSHACRPGRGTGVIAVLFFGVAFVSTLLALLALVAREAMEAHLTRGGMNRITIARTGEFGLNGLDLQRLMGHVAGVKGVRLVPQITTMVHLRGRDGVPRPFLATSYQSDDPLLAELPSLWRGTPAGGNGIVISPDILRRLGFPPSSQPPGELAMLVAGPGGVSLESTLGVESLVGSLGDLGVRIAWERMTEVRSLQTGMSLAELEINAIHVLVPRQITIQSMIDQLKRADPQLQFSSPWFDRAGQREFAGAALAVGGPILGTMLLFNIIVAALLCVQRVSADRRAIVLARLNGATATQVLLWNVFPRWYLSGGAGLAGIIAARLLLSGKFAAVLKGLAGVAGGAQQDLVLPLVGGLAIVAMLAHMLPVIPLLKVSQLDKVAGEG